MRFFTTVHKAGRLEFIAIFVVLGLANWWLFTGYLGIQVPSTVEEAESFMQTVSDSPKLPTYLIGVTVVGFLQVINAARRLKDVGKSGWAALMMLVPISSLLLFLYLAVASDSSQRTYTPYGDNPYDPNSWVPPAAANTSGSAVSYNGTDLFLPGEEENSTERAA